MASWKNPAAGKRSKKRSVDLCVLCARRRRTLTGLSAALARQGNRLQAAGRGAEALAIARRETGIFFVDLSDGFQEGIDLVRRLQALSEPPQIIAVVSASALEAALTAVRQGAHDYLTLPLREGELSHVLARARERRLVERRSRAVFSQRPAVFPDLVGRSPSTRQIRSFVEKSSRASLPVLLSGETGTGKDLVARLIHQKSSRVGAPFVALNCAELTADLHTAQLFGYEKGSFTGAAERHPGVFETADGGTLFLDEIDALHPASQAGLLRVIENGELRRVGAAATIHVNVRVIVAASAELAKLVGEGKFRKDLFFRVNALTFRVPSLRERARDIPDLAQYFLERLRGGRRELAFAREALGVLAAYPWPGNVRELRNLVERLVLTIPAGERITAADVRGHLAAALARPAAEDPVGETLESVEKAHIVKILERYHGNKTRTARGLGISLRNLYQKINRYKLVSAAQEMRKRA